MRRQTSAYHFNVKLARATWGELSKTAVRCLRNLTEEYNLSVATGDLQFLEGHWYITHAGLLRIAQRKHCSGIKSALVDRFSDPLAGRWIFRATVFKSQKSRGFTAFGDADPSNVSSLVRGAEMRVAETRAVCRALRKAYAIGICSVEELGAFSGPPRSSSGQLESSGSHRSNGSSNGQPRLRDQLCVLIRQYNLDPTLVKAYAADFCGTETLSEASRDLVESFISHLSASAKESRDALVCKLNSYAQPQEARP
jgi:hypothetical protein